MRVRGVTVSRVYADGDDDGEQTKSAYYLCLRRTEFRAVKLGSARSSGRRSCLSGADRCVQGVLPK